MSDERHEPIPFIVWCWAFTVPLLFILPGIAWWFTAVMSGIAWLYIAIWVYRKRASSVEGDVR